VPVPSGQECLTSTESSFLDRGDRKVSFGSAWLSIGALFLWLRSRLLFQQVHPEKSKARILVKSGAFQDILGDNYAEPRMAVRTFP
jgi:hypothetical protein